jgi:hypothetical protein
MAKLQTQLGEDWILLVKAVKVLNEGGGRSPSGTR